MEMNPMVRIMEDITDEYNRDPNSGCRITSTGQDYRQLFPPGWPKRNPNLHYEVILEGQPPLFYIEIHLEYKPAFDNLMDEIINRCADNITSTFPANSPGVRDRGGDLGRALGCRFNLNSTDMQIAEALRTLVDITREPITQILQARDLLR
jgi:hypothetical protein